MAYIFLDGILFRIRDINSILLCYVIGIYVNKMHGEINFSFKENHNLEIWVKKQKVSENSFYWILIFCFLTFIVFFFQII